MSDENTFTTTVHELSSAQGWSTEVLGQLALDFLTHSASAQTQKHFLTRLHQIQQEENETGQPVPDFVPSPTLSEVDQPHVLTHHLRQLGCAVACFSPGEVRAEDADYLEEIMISRGNDALEELYGSSDGDLDD